jgi:hypothetical protein
MLLFDLCVYLILSLSVSFMWSFSEIFSPVRNFVAGIPYIRRPLTCPECSSFWMGVLTAAFFNPFLGAFGALPVVSYAFCGLSTHLVACYAYKLYFLIEDRLNR